jgi:hypothetical protein
VNAVGSAVGATKIGVAAGPGVGPGLGAKRSRGGSVGRGALGSAMPALKLAVTPGGSV